MIHILLNSLQYFNLLKVANGVIYFLNYCNATSGDRKVANAAKSEIKLIFFYFIFCLVKETKLNFKNTVVLTFCMQAFYAI